MRVFVTLSDAKSLDAALIMVREGFDYQVVIADNRPLIYEIDHDLGVEVARAYNDTVAEDIGGRERFIGTAWVYLPDVPEAIRELRRAVKELGFKGVKLMGGHAFDTVGFQSRVTSGLAVVARGRA